MPKLDLKKLKEVIKFTPHEKQREVLRKQTRFTTLNWGRRSGKTMLAAYIALKYLIASDHNIWIVAPTYDLSKRCWDYLIQWVPIINKTFGRLLIVNKSQFTIKSKTGSQLALKSSDNPASLLGAGLDLLIVDEAARVIYVVMRPPPRSTLTDRQGKAIFISTPYGKNWFYNLYLKGISTDKEHEDYSYFHMKTAENTAIPHIKDDVGKAKLELPINDYLQEYEAEFIEGAGSVFRGVRDCLYPVDFRSFPFHGESYNENHVYQGGVDLARLTDFTVATMVDKSQDVFKVVAVDRFNEVDYKVQKPRLTLFSEKFSNPPVNIERNNIGDAVIDDMPPNFYPFTTTNQSKKDLINNLAILIEQKKIKIPNIPTLVNELEAFSYEITSNGNIKYSAPVGYHDDHVMSLALACKDLKNVASTQTVESYLPDSSYTYDDY